MENRDDQIVYINLIAYPLLTLGPDTRVGLWFQGCNIRCEGCISKYTWEKSSQYKKTLNKIVKQLKSYKCKNLTISGGEPFEQPNALYNLLKKIRPHFSDILIYSGYKYEFLSNKYLNILQFIDVLIDGEYQKDIPSNKAYKGSKNQRMYILNRKVLPKYEKYFSQSKTELQIYNDSNTIYILGIPDLTDNTIKGGFYGI